VSPETVRLHHLVESATRSGPVDGVGELLSVLFVLNVLLFVFNMLPVPPLDGASAIGGVLPERAALAVRGFMANPALSLLGLFIAWQVFPYVARPLFGMLVRIVYPADMYD
jgi:Zn-dependent protease